MKKEQDFTRGRILPSLVRFALPVLLAIFLQTMYGAVDMLIVGRFNDAAEISAVSTGSWIMQTITMGIVGLAMGTTILLGQRIGEKKPEEAGRVVGASICIFVVVGLCITVVMELMAVPVTRIMQAPPEAFESTVVYIRICSAGAVFIVAYNVLGSIFRGMGNSKMPLLTVAIACVCNIAGDLLFVGVLHMAAAGAAIATVLAQVISVVLSAYIIKRQGLPFHFDKSCIRFDGKNIRRIIKLGFPIALQDILVAVSFLVITAIVNGMGVVAAAGVGVAEKICGFVMLVPSAFGQTISAFVAQNVGAKEMGRAKTALRYSIMLSLGIGMFLAYFSFFHGDIMAGIFNSETQVIAAGAEYLKAYAIDCLLVSFMFCFTGFFNGCGKTTFVMIQGIIGAFGVRIPVSYLMSRLVPVSLFKIGLATPASTLIQIVLCVAYYVWFNKASEKTLY